VPGLFEDRADEACDVAIVIDNEDPAAQGARSGAGGGFLLEHVVTKYGKSRAICEDDRSLVSKARVPHS
jgi:hypothetical protein